MKTELEKQFEKDDQWLNFTQSTKYMVIPVTHGYCQYLLWSSEFSWWWKILLTVPCLFLGMMACGFVGLFFYMVLQVINKIPFKSKKINTRKLNVRGLMLYPVTNGLFIALVLYGCHLLGIASDWAFSKDMWLIGSPIGVVKLIILVMSAFVALGVFTQWLKLIGLFSSHEGVLVQGVFVKLVNEGKPKTQRTVVRVSELLDEIVTVFYRRIKRAIIENKGNYPSDSDLSVNEKYIMNEVIYLLCLRQIYSKSAEKQKCLTIIASWILELSENDNQLIKLGTAKGAFNFANDQIESIFSEVELNSVEPLGEKIKRMAGGLVKRLERINKSPDTLGFMDKQISYIKRISNIDRSLNAIISDEDAIDDCDLYN